MDYKEILNLLLDKQKKGLEELYNAYGRKFYAYAVDKWKFDEDTSWDIVYQTLDTLVLKLNDYEFKSKAHFESFIFKVFLNYLRQYFRKNREEQYNTVKYLDLSENMDVVDSESEEFVKELQNKIDENFIKDYYENEQFDNGKLSDLKQALGKMDVMDKDILLLRAQNYTYDEIAEILRIENAQLKVKHHRAKLKLLKLLNKTTTD